VHQSPFHAFHQEQGAKFVDFAGWEMPIHYGSIREEHQQVRQRGGLFDVSHMGRLRIQGRHGRRLLEIALSRYVSDLATGRCRYAFVLNEAGGILDDILVYRFEEHWLLVVNAANREKILQHLQAVVEARQLAAEVKDQTFETAMLAVQGPAVMEHIGRFSSEVPTLGRYHFCRKNLLVLKMTISRTGYTGEDGVEVILPAGMASMALKLLYKKPTPEDPGVLRPAGLGARDTLRLEAGMPLYGHELGESLDPLAAGLDFAVTLDKDEREKGEPFIGQQALKRIAETGPARRLVGLAMEGRRTPREGMSILKDGTAVGTVTSGCLSPTLGHPIAMAYIETAHAGEGQTLAIDFGSRTVEARIVPLPFYKNK